METALLFVILLLILIWINLYKNLHKTQTKIDALMKEVKMLKGGLDVKQPVSEAVVQAKTQVEEKTVTLPPVQKPSPVLAKPKKPKKERTPIDYEKYIGENLFGKIGILILVIGMGFFVKYAIDKNWINEVLRTLLGFAVGGGLITLSWVLRKKYHAFSSVLAGGGFAIFYVTVAVAYHYYALFSQTGAFILLVLFTVLMSGLAIWYDRRELALVALVGGFVAPFLVSSGSDNYITLFSYVVILNMGMFALSLYKKWGELPIACFLLTWLTFALYILKTDMLLVGNVKLIHLQIFATLFYLIFQASVAPIVRINRQSINQLLLAVIILNNFIFLYYALTLHWQMHYVSNYGGAITLFIALVNIATFFWIRKRGERFPFLLQTFLWLALTFVSITVPIQLEGSMITIFWASELVLVMLLYTRFRQKVYEFFALLLFALTLISYLLDIENALTWGASPDKSMFINGLFLTGLFTGGACMISAYLLDRVKEALPEKGWIRFSPHNAIAVITGTLVFYVAFILEFYLYIGNKLFAQVLMRLFTTIVIFLLTWLYHSRFSIYSHIRGYMVLLGVSALSFISLSNLVNHAYDSDAILRVFQWAALLVVVAHGIYLASIYYKQEGFGSKTARRVALYLSLLYTIILVMTTYNLLSLLSLTDEANAGLSIALGIAGFIQMSLGMRLHLKTLRMISLATFGIVLLKLVVVDLWLMPTVGKIIVFIILGIILLVLSFLYQKLKAVLFDNDKDGAVATKEELPE
ncbi:putative membrane protein [Parabacteroides sp. PF5-5]|uniref:DUF2339 domain-containing protein n=1 Tax=unclassified Parabacteroides TaxID=2649774 RepID=UPI0024766B3E|nr:MULTISPECIES: DUF2339 domain-containing protein [unclassified Parabacteroides]MDH6305053.1 putative membrane protein [Parabacteroides sp. PH5-39]MDH6315862.1 putative membrane protein [Parabacteroides sp. PF5-13]MDH6319519.1 putative membrane protein [Parabacteroides sp. PH5-13]MDH6323250.1 putative membrane protein [Parabacteroides sp. PH5-8]MDH6327242.1 putative membrane protein [Parabacteroides sp. PH5-41]